MTFVHPCVEQVRHSNVTVEERGRRANFLNPSNARFLRAKVDNCLIKQGVRADWIVTKVGVGSVIVELKGSDVAHACDQLLVTLVHQATQEWLEERRTLLTICSRRPSNDTRAQRAEERARKLGLRLRIYCNQRDIVIEDLFGIPPPATNTPAQSRRRRSSHRRR